jgi:DNA-binding transcriptional LysR family regulator
MVTFRQLEALTAVVDMKSFARAARHLQTSQSAVSRLIAELEEGFDRPLFNRDQRATRLTMEGEEVLGLARAILRYRNGLAERISSPELVTSTLRLGATEGAAITWLPRFLAQLRSQHPRLHLELDIGSSTSLHGRLRDGQLDIAITAAAIRSTGMARFPVGTAQTGWFCSPRLELQTALVPQELEQQTLLIQGPMSGAGMQLAAWLDERRMRPSNIIHSDSLMALLGMAAAGLGLANLPRAVAHDAVERGALREVNLTLGSPEIDYIALVRIDTISSLHRWVVQLARDTCNFDLPFQDVEPGPHETRRGIPC